MEVFLGFSNVIRIDGSVTYMGVVKRIHRFIAACFKILALWGKKKSFSPCTSHEVVVTWFGHYVKLAVRQSPSGHDAANRDKYFLFQIGRAHV